MNRFNERLALFITKGVGTMYCAYLFAIIGIMGITGALTGNVSLVLIVGAISGYFLQLVLLPIIMVGQNLASKKANEIHQTHKDTQELVQDLHAKIDAVHNHLGIKEKK